MEKILISGEYNEHISNRGKGLVGKNLVANLKSIQANKNRSRPNIVIDEIFEYAIDTDLARAVCPGTSGCFCRKCVVISVSVRGKGNMLSLYICVFIVVSVLAILTLIKPEYSKKLYYISWGLMTVFLCLRFGQGTDYRGYLYIYETADTIFSSQYGLLAYFEGIHSEIGWKCLMILFKLIGAEFWMVTILISLATMVCTHMFIVKFCHRYRTIALVLLYPTIYLTYYFSAFRQGMAMALFFGVVLSKLLDKKYASYIVGVALLSTIHVASLCYLILPIVIRMDKKILKIGFILSVLFTIVMLVEPMRELLKNIAVIFGAHEMYFGDITFNLFSLLERLMMAGLIWGLCRLAKFNEDAQRRVDPLLKIYFIGVIIYICLCTNAFISSRISIMFKMAEIALIPMLLEGLEDIIRKGAFLIFLGMSSIMVYKNLNYYAEGYYENISGWNYPYVTIFNQKDILKYREEYVNYDYLKEGFFESNYIQ